MSLQNKAIRVQRNLRVKGPIGIEFEIMCGPRRMALCEHENDADHLVECAKLIELIERVNPSLLEAYRKELL